MLVSTSTGTYMGTVTVGPAGVPNVSVQLRDENGFSTVASAATDAGGGFSMTAVPGTYTRFLSGGSFASPLLPASFFLTVGGTFPLAGTVTENFDLGGAHALRGTVVDADGAPVPNVGVSLFMGVDAFGPFSVGSQSGSGQTDEQGDFTFRLYPGAGTLNASAPSGSGLVNFSVPNVTIVADDLEQGILLQFTSESSGTTVGPGGTVTTDPEGDGATPSDPVETSVTTPVGGTVNITESPVALVPPSGFRFLTQQVNISAPAATPGDPLRIVFVLDASRIPPRQDEHTIQIFKNAVLAAACAGAPGVADPDPCVSLRERLADGDVRLTVLSSTASAWNLGVGLGECGEDADCDDGIPCTADACQDDTCVHTPDDGACDDGAPCNGAETCNVETGCESGDAVACGDDGNPCTDDACDPDTGTCGIPNDADCDDGDPCTTGEGCTEGVCGDGVPRECADDGNPCTADVCDPDTGTCGSPLTGPPCDDGTACTTDDHCVDGACVGSAGGSSGPFAAAECELGSILANEPCAPGELDPRMLVRFQKRVALALRLLARAAGADRALAAARALRAADHALEHLKKQITREKPTRVSRACKSVLIPRVLQARMTVQELANAR